MKRAWIFAALALTGGCAALAGCGLFGGDSGSTPVDENTPPDNMSEEQTKAYEALGRYLRSAADGDFATYFDLRSAFSKSEWLYAVLCRNQGRTVLPRQTEMSGPLRTEVINWFNYNLGQGAGKPNGPRVTVIDLSVRRSSWLSDVLRDDYQRGFDENKRIWGGAHIAQTPPRLDPEGLIFEVILYNKDVALHEMKKEDDAWRIQYVLGMGPSR